MCACMPPQSSEGQKTTYGRQVPSPYTTLSPEAPTWVIRLGGGYHYTPSYLTGPTYVCLLIFETVLLYSPNLQLLCLRFLMLVQDIWKRCIPPHLRHIFKCNPIDLFLLSSFVLKEGLPGLHNSLCRQNYARIYSDSPVFVSKMLGLQICTRHTRLCINVLYLTRPHYVAQAGLNF